MWEKIKNSHPAPPKFDTSFFPSRQQATTMESTALSSAAAPAADESLVATNGDDVRRPSPKSVASNNATNFNDKSANAYNDEPGESNPNASIAATPNANASDADEEDEINNMQLVPTASIEKEVASQQITVASPSTVESKWFQSIFAGFTLNRENIMIVGLAIAGAMLTTFAGTVCFIGVAAAVSSPLWIPLLVITSPLWMPLAFFTSPLWVSAVAIGAICLLWAAFLAFLAFGTFLFFAWPAKWLPKDSDKAKWFLYQRDKTTLSLVKLQAKLVLYAAGVGPLADAAFAITDRIDLVELQKALSDFDLAQFAEDVKKMDIREIQAAIIGAVRSFIGL